MLSDLAALKGFLSIPASDVSRDGTLAGLLAAADAAVKNYCKRLFETQIVTEYPFRLGGEAIVVEQTPVLSYRLAGNISNGQATITGLTSTNSLFVGMPIVVAFGPNRQSTQPFPNGATIQSIDSSSQVTINGNATYSIASATVIFGLSMWWDPSGAFGDGLGTDSAGPFGPTTLLYPGLDYALQRDQSNGTSKSGKVTRLASAFGLAGMGGAWGAYGSSWSGLQQRGTLSGPLLPLWPKYPPGSLKIQYAAGLGAWLSPPAAPTLATATTGGTVAAGTYSVLVTYTNAYGETMASAVSTITTTGSTSTLTITSPSASSLLIGNATGWNCYVASVANGVTAAYVKQNSSPTAIGTNLTLTSVAVTGAGVPATNTATQVPADLTAAVNAVAGWMLNNADNGLLQTQNESFQGYSGAVAQAVDALKSDAELGSTRQILSRWRKVSI